jgi:thioredoxin reductase (NADPH)
MTVQPSVPDRVLILGAGPAGYTAAIYAARAGLMPRLVAGLQPGGQLTTTTEVENWPGEVAINGPALVEKMRIQAEHYGARMEHDVVVGVDLSTRPFVVRGDSGASWQAETLIVATGAQARWLSLPSEQALRGAGVSACATCDGFFFRGRDVVVVGGGNSAVEEALYLANLARSVTLVHRRDRLRAERILQDRLFAQPRVSVAWDSVVEEVLAAGNPASVIAVRLRHTRIGAVRDLPADGVFVAIGHDPATALFRGQLDLDAEGYVVTAPDSMRTSVPGVFAAGDVRDRHFRQAVTAAGMGCMAALEADRFLLEAPQPLVNTPEAAFA